jgi:predicted nucleic acid-binding protein
VSVLLDTSLLIAGYDPGDETVAVSTISVGELQLGVLRASDPQIALSRRERLLAILLGTEVLPVTESVAASYGVLCHNTGRHQTNDLWIAATADAHGIRLLTGDERQAALPIDVEYVNT